MAPVSGGWSHRARARATRVGHHLKRATPAASTPPADEPTPLPAPAEQVTIFADQRLYSAFPHMIPLEGDELLVAFRVAPIEVPGGPATDGPIDHTHTHPRSSILVIRSSDAGRHWDLNSATELAAGGGQELGLIYLGDGRVGGCLAAHEVIPHNLEERGGITKTHPFEFAFRSQGAAWVWSDNFGLSWRQHNRVQIDLQYTSWANAGVQGSSSTQLAGSSQPCGPPVQLTSGAILVPVYGAAPQSLNNDAKVSVPAEDGTAPASAFFYSATNPTINQQEAYGWSEAVMIAAGVPGLHGWAEPCLMEFGADPGHLLCLLRSAPVDSEQSPPGMLWATHSTTGGADWSTPTQTGLLSGTCPRLLQLRDGRLLLTYGRRYPPYGICAAISTDQGRSWASSGGPYMLRSMPSANMGYTSSVELDETTVLTVSYGELPGQEGEVGTVGIIGTRWTLPPA